MPETPGWRPWSRGDALALTALGVGLLGSLPFWVHPWYDPMNDAATYILVARSLAAGEGYALLGEPFVLRPPLFPGLLALVIGRAGTDFAAMNLLVSGFGVAGALLLFAFLRPRLGWLLALLTSLGVWLSPGYQRLRNQVMSDVPATASLLLCLILERWATREPSWRREVLLGVAVGAAAHVRAMLALLLPAILFARTWQQLGAEPHRREWRSFLGQRCAIVALAACLILLPWNLRTALNAPPPPADQTRAYSYATGMWHQDQGDPASPRIGPRDLVRRLLKQSRLIAAALGSGLRDAEWSRSRAAAGILMIACLAAVLLRRREPAETFAMGVLALISVYFGFRPRLILPAYVIALAAAVLVLRDATLRLGGSRAAAWVAPAAVALLVALAFEPRRAWTEIEVRHRQLGERAEAIAARLPQDARPASAIGTHYAVLLERPVWSLEFAVSRAGHAHAAEEIIDKYGLDTVVLSPEERLEARLIPYFRERYPEVEEAGSALLFRVRP